MWLVAGKRKNPSVGLILARNSSQLHQQKVIATNALTNADLNLFSEWYAFICHFNACWTSCVWHICSVPYCRWKWSKCIVKRMFWCIFSMARLHLVLQVFFHRQHSKSKQSEYAVSQNILLLCIKCGATWLIERNDANMLNTFISKPSEYAVSLNIFINNSVTFVF